MKDDNTASAKGTDLPISTKHSIEICSFIKHKPLNRVRKQLSLVLDMKLAVPLKRFHKDRGHRKGRIGPGFFPQKATREIIKLLKTLESNAQSKGLNTDSLIIKKAISNKASIPMRIGRSRTSSKRTHIELTVEEKETKKKTKEPLKQQTKIKEQAKK